MRKYLFILLFIFSGYMFSQSSGITYQAVIYNPAGQELPGEDNMYTPLNEQDICLRFNFLTSEGLEYQEVVQTTTDVFGMVNILIGNDIQSSGSADGFDGVVWDGSEKWMMVEVDIKGTCSDYDQISNQPFTYVPFAYYSANAGGPGPAGPQGEQGDVGLTGEQGTTGPQGEQGDVGQTGEQGLTGTTGPQGEQGDIGLTGGQGLTGTTGPQGEQGDVGQTGGQGLTGTTGPQGEQGDVGQTGGQGPTGESGLTAYEVWINLGNTGTKQEFIDSLVGPQGETGLLAEGTEEGNTTYWNGTEWVLNSNNLYNDGTNVMIGTSTADASSALTIESTSQGILIPRMTLVQRDAITTPATGLLIFQADDAVGFYYYDGVKWTNLASSNTTSGSSGSGGGNASKTLIYTIDGF